MINTEHTKSCTAFEGGSIIASGDLPQVVSATKAVMDRGTNKPVLIFDDATSDLIEIDFRGTLDEVMQRLPGNQPEPPRGRGRPRLGVTAREVTLLPRHWDWLNAQPGGASVALRKLVQKASTAHEDKDRIRKAQEVCYKFMSAMAGDLPGFEEATRALFAGNSERFKKCIEAWPAGARDHTRKLALPALLV